MSVNPLKLRHNGWFRKSKMH